jgi:HupE / UreJ protein
VTRRHVRAALAALTLSLALAPGAVSAHTLASSSVRLVVGDHDLTGTVTLAVATLDKAFTSDQRSDVLSADDYATQVISYVDAHLEIDNTEGNAWVEHYTNLDRQTTEGIETITIDLQVDPGSADPADFSITYDAVIEAVTGHEAVLVLEDAAGTVSTPGVFTSDRHTVDIGQDTGDVAFTDNIRFGFHHVLDGADHLLFLLTLLLPASFVVADRRWKRQPGVTLSARKILHVVTAFTIGHSLTLAATSLGWITVPSRLVEVLIAASVAVSAVHAIRPLHHGGEPVIAATFGLVHGLAFAGILHSIGLQGRTSLIALLAFNIGIELAQLAVVLFVLPSLYVLTTGPGGERFRVVGATVALVAASAWIFDRIGLGTSPITPIETALVAHPWTVVITLAMLAVVTTLTFGRSADHPVHTARLAFATRAGPKSAQATPTPLSDLPA